MGSRHESAVTVTSRPGRTQRKGQSIIANTLAAEGTGFRQDLRDLGEGVGTLKDDVKNLAQGAATAAKSGASELGESAKHVIQAAKDKLDGARQAAADATDSLKGVVSRNPLASIGIAIGVGVLVGAIVSRCRS
ncbi:MAG: hypothetical protein AABZ53_06455 [Planctomycetota bacterium]